MYGIPIISSILVKIRLYAENQLPRLPGSSLKDPVVVVVVGSYPLSSQSPTRVEVELGCDKINIHQPGCILQSYQNIFWALIYLATMPTGTHFRQLSTKPGQIRLSGITLLHSQLVNRKKIKQEWISQYEIQCPLPTCTYIYLQSYYFDSLCQSLLNHSLHKSKFPGLSCGLCYIRECEVISN